MEEPWLQQGPTWIDYAPSWNQTIERAFQFRLLTVVFDHYTIDLVRMVQTNQNTLRERPVRRALTETVPEPAMGVPEAAQIGQEVWL
jgi:hypothetical protein